MTFPGEPALPHSYFMWSNWSSLHSEFQECSWPVRMPLSLTIVIVSRLGMWSSQNQPGLWLEQLEELSFLYSGLDLGRQTPESSRTHHMKRNCLWTKPTQKKAGSKWWLMTPALAGKLFTTHLASSHLPKSTFFSSALDPVLPPPIRGSGISLLSAWGLSLPPEFPQDKCTGLQ